MAVASIVRSAQVGEYIHALRLIFGAFTPEMRDQRCLIGLYLISRGDLDPAGLLVVPGGEGEGPQGAILAQRLPGAAGVMWPPGVPPGDQRGAIEDLLCRTARTWLREGGALLAQALVGDEERATAAALERNGFARITDLWMMRHSLAEVPPPLPVTCRSWDEVDQAVFTATLLRTYEGSLDCPELAEVRSGAEIIKGHQNTGIFDPQRWWLVLEDERPVGVMLLTEMPDEKNWDVSYVGVVPEMRRRGLGRKLMVKALALAKEAGAPALTLSVDGRNEPARQLYRSLGFEAVEQRAVYLALRI